MTSGLRPMQSAKRAVGCEIDQQVEGGGRSGGPDRVAARLADPARPEDALPQGASMTVGRAMAGEGEGATTGRVERRSEREMSAGTFDARVSSGSAGSFRLITASAGTVRVGGGVRVVEDEGPPGVRVTLCAGGDGPDVGTVLPGPGASRSTRGESEFFTYRNVARAPAAPPTVHPRSSAPINAADRPGRLEVRPSRSAVISPCPVPVFPRGSRGACRPCGQSPNSSSSCRRMAARARSSAAVTLEVSSL